MNLIWAAALIPALAGLALWALLDLQRFVLFALLGLQILPNTIAQPAGTQVAIADLALLLAMAAWLVNNALGTAPDPQVARNSLWLPLLLFVAVNAASIAWSDRPQATVVFTVQLVEIALVYPLIFGSLRPSAALVRRGLLLFVGLTSIMAIAAAAVFVPRAAAGHIEGAFVLGIHKNAVGSFVGAGLVLAYSFWLSERRPGVRFALAVALVVLAMGLFASVSRGAIVGALVSLLVICFLLRRRRAVTIAVVTVSAVALLAVIGPQASREKDRTGAYDSSVVRQYSYASAVRKVRAHPLLGTGAGAYSDYIPELRIGLPDPNNMFLLTWAETGVLGLLALLFALYRFVALLRRLRRLEPELAVLGVGAGAVALSLLVHFQFDVTWTRGTSSLAFAAMGIMLALERMPAPEIAAEVATEIAPPAPSRREAPAPPPPAPVVRDLPTPPRPAPLRVLHVVSTKAFAGLERHVLGLVDELRKLGCQAELVCPKSAGALRREAQNRGVPVQPESASPLPWQLGAARHLVSARPDAIHVHDGQAAAIAAGLAPRGPRGLLIRTQHFIRPASVERDGWRGRASTSLHRAANQRLDAYVAVSDAVAQAAVRRRETGDAELAIIPPGIALPSDSAVARAQAIRDELAHPVIAFIGRLEAERRLDVLLASIPLVLESLPAARFIIAGSGQAEQELRRTAQRLGVDGAIEWLGWIDGPEAVLARTHVYVNTWPWEAFGMAMAEAQAFGIPVVAPSAGANPELVSAGATGLLFTPGDPRALAACLIELASDRARSTAMGHAARRWALARYGRGDTARTTLALYERLQAGRA